MSATYVGRVVTEGESMARSTTSVHAFKIFMDEPEELGGRNGAPSPLDFVLAAHAGCLNYMTFFIANEMGIPVTGTRISLEASLDPGGFTGAIVGVRPGYRGIRATIEVATTAEGDAVDRLRRAVEARCPVSDNLQNPTPVAIQMHRLGSVGTTAV